MTDDPTKSNEPVTDDNYTDSAVTPEDESTPGDEKADDPTPEAKDER